MTIISILLAAFTVALQIYTFILLTEVSPFDDFRQWSQRRRDDRRLRQGWTREIVVTGGEFSGNVAVGVRWVPPPTQSSTTTEGSVRIMIHRAL